MAKLDLVEAQLDRALTKLDLVQTGLDLVMTKSCNAYAGADCAKALKLNIRCYIDFVRVIGEF